METKNKLGNALEKKLQGASKIAPPAIWDKINSSLDKRERRRKRIFWMWSAGILLLISGGIYIASTQSADENEIITVSEMMHKGIEDNTLKKATEMNNTQRIIPSETIEKSHLIEHDLGTTEFENELSTTENKKVVLISNEKNNYDISEVTRKKQTKKTATPTYEVTKNYRYYNSKTKEEIMTENKKIMDSVVKKNIQLQKSLDSVTRLNREKVTDSL